EDSTNEQSLQASSLTTNALLTNAYVESSSITSIPTVDSSIQSTNLLQTIFDSTMSQIDLSKTSTEYNSQISTLTTTIPTNEYITSSAIPITEQIRMTALINQNSTDANTITNNNIFTIQTTEESSTMPNNDYTSSMDLLEPLSTETGKTSLISDTTLSTQMNKISDSNTEPISLSTYENVFSSINPITYTGTTSTIMSVDTTLKIQLPTSIETSISSSSSTLDIITSSNSQSATAEVATETSYISSFDITTNNINVVSTSHFNLDSSTLSNSPTSKIELTTEVFSTMNSEMLTTLATTFSTVYDQFSSSAQRSSVSSSQPVTTTGVTMVGATTELFVETSSVTSSTLVPSIYDTLSYQTFSSVEPSSPLSTLSSVTLEMISTTLKPAISTTNLNLNTDLITSEPITNQSTSQ
ncbi:unnamed protein product, partial [Rotaria magnacalcarata]